MSQPGLLLYFTEWDEFLEDATARDVGCVLEALFTYCRTGELTEFDDKSVRQFYRRQIRIIDADMAKYKEKCSRNAYNHYCGKVRQQGGSPLDYEDWQKDPKGAEANININTNTNKNININKNKRRWASDPVPEKTEEERREEFLKTLEDLKKG